MAGQSARGVLHYLQQVPDPRGREGRRHSHIAMLAVMLCATLSGFPGFAGAAHWIRLQPLSFWHALGGTRKPPCENAFRYLMLKLAPKALEAALMQWLQEGLNVSIGEHDLQAIVLDGKVLRGTLTRHRRALMILAAFDVATGSVLSQTPVDPATNEAKTGLQLLTDMVLDGKVIIGDAAYCDQEICREVVDSEGDYLVIVKDNQPNLHKQARQAFVIPEGFSPLRKTPGRPATAAG